MTIPFLGLQFDHGEMSAEGSSKFQTGKKKGKSFTSTPWLLFKSETPVRPPVCFSLINRLMSEKMKDLTGAPFHNKDFLRVCMINISSRLLIYLLPLWVRMAKVKLLSLRIYLLNIYPAGSICARRQTQETNSAGKQMQRKKRRSDGLKSLPKDRLESEF